MAERELRITSVPASGTIDVSNAPVLRSLHISQGGFGSSTFYQVGLFKPAAVVAEDFWSEVSMPVKGVWIPTGSLDIWKAARALHASQLVEVVFIGDSTTEGSDYNGTSNSYLNTLRTLSSAVYTDGGRGIFPQTDTSAASGETLSGINTAGSWTAPPDEANPLLGRGFSSSGAGAAIVFQGYGTKARLLCMAGAGGGSFTWAANGGGTTAVNLAANESKAVLISSLAGNPNTLSINNTGATRLDLTCEFLKSTGIVYHKHARFGAAAFSWWNPDNLAGPTDALPLQLALGVTPGHASSANGFDYGNPVDPSAAARKPSLVCINIGLNDINLWSNTTGDYAHRDSIMLEQSTAGIILMAQAAGADVLVIIPHLQYDASPYMAKNGARARTALWHLAMSMNCACVDFHVPLGINTKTAIANGYLGDGVNPHLQPAGYVAQGTWLWTNCLSL